MRSYGWRPEVNMASLLEVIDTAELDKKRPPCNGKISVTCSLPDHVCKPVHTRAKETHDHPKPMCLIEDVKSLAERFRKNDTITNGNKRTRMFVDSDNILLSVFEYESRRNRGLFSLINNKNSTFNEQLRLPSIHSAANNVKRQVNSPKRMTVSLPTDHLPSCRATSGENGPVRLQYQHRSREESSRNLASNSKLISIIRKTPDDSIDVVCKANQPGDYLSFRNCSPSAIRVSPISMSTRAQRMLHTPDLEINDGKSNSLEIKMKHYRTDRYIGNRSSNEFDDDWEGVEDDPDVALVPDSKSQDRDFDRINRINRQRMEHLNTYDPDLHSKVYVRALRDARNKYFKHIPLNTTLTKPYEFSYFTILNHSDPGSVPQEKRIKKPYGMKRIFGEVRQDDYYPLFIKK